MAQVNFHPYVHMRAQNKCYNMLMHNSEKKVRKYTNRKERKKERETENFTALFDWGQVDEGHWYLKARVTRRMVEVWERDCYGRGVY